MKNQYQDDIVFKNILKKLLPATVLNDIEPDLSQFGERVITGIAWACVVHPLRRVVLIKAFSTDIAAMGEDVETPNNYPQLKQYDAWCRRVDEISTAQGWKDLNDVAAKEG